MTRPIILLAHGAGAPSTSRWMQAWAGRLAALGEVETFDYPYVKAGRRSPDKLPALVEAHRAALEAARARLGRDRPFVLAGKSMGSRVGCHLAVDLARDGARAAALVCFGYPLRSGTSGAFRDGVLLALETPILFLQGTRDPLCRIAELEEVRGRMKAPSSLFPVEGGDHSLELRARELKAQGRSQAEWDEAVLGAVRGFLAGLALEAPPP